MTDKNAELYFAFIIKEKDKVRDEMAELRAQLREKQARFDALLDCRCAFQDHMKPDPSEPKERG